MVTVKMPRGSWDQVLLILDDYKQQGYLVGPLIKEITDQTDKQEN
jgi:hypothetical protein